MQGECANHSNCRPVACEHKNGRYNVDSDVETPIYSMRCVISHVKTPGGCAVKTIQMTVPDDFSSQVDTNVDDLGTSRTASGCEALSAALSRARLRQMERQHAVGYARHPVQPGEFDVWADEQAPSI